MLSLYNAIYRVNKNGPCNMGIAFIKGQFYKETLENDNEMVIFL